MIFKCMSMTFQSFRSRAAEVETSCTLCSARRKLISPRAQCIVFPVVVVCGCGGLYTICIYVQTERCPFFIVKYTTLAKRSRVCLKASTRALCFCFLNYSKMCCDGGTQTVFFPLPFFGFVCMLFLFCFVPIFFSTLLAVPLGMGGKETALCQLGGNN